MGMFGALFKALTKPNRRPAVKNNSARLLLSERDIEIVRMTAQRMVDVVNESLRIAATSKNKATRLSRIGVARKTLARLRAQQAKFPVIQIFSSLQVETDLMRLESEALAMPDPPPKKTRAKRKPLG
jgi:hypothetical protein